MFDDFLVRAAIAALGVALASAPLGVFVVWRRMAYFGDATAHASVLGVALSLAFTAPVFIGTLLVALGMAGAVATLAGKRFGSDMVLGVASHTALALGILAASLVPAARVDLEAYLFGDILAVGKSDLLVIWAGGALVVGLIAWRWKSLLLSTVAPDLAHAAGVSPEREGRVLVLGLALVVAVAVKVVGALLIGAMLVIPAAAARPFARTPEAMVLGAAAIGAIAALGGFWGSWTFDTPTGASIVVTATLLFVVLRSAGALWSRHSQEG